jgi:hypothetical protein
MDQDSIRRHIAEKFAGVDVTIASQETGAPELAWGDTFFIYDPNGNLPANRQFPFATIVTKDYGDFDSASNLNRPSVFRLNIGVSKETFGKLFGSEAAPGTPSGVIDGAFDFAELDRLLPHPIYGRNHWVCVLNPSDATFESLKPLLAEAYEIAVGRLSKARPAG